MEVKAHLNQLRIAPRKVRLVANLVRGLSVAAAAAQLQFLNKQAAVPLQKLLSSAVATAEHNYKLTSKTLYINSIRVNEGTALKRWKPRAMGRATLIKKRSANVTLVLGNKSSKT
ncbi:MAG: 50S ribosomal protein L22 [Patescibacteria group bacterium]|jgi:large subunit ribosomal protein L22